MIYKKESYDIIGTLFEVHNNLGGDFLEVLGNKLCILANFKNESIEFKRIVLSF